ncbi:homoserine kinase [Phytoactinopolyspora limicola]|uniref:homoserine kinase n=1 Tax=Phytoactinopolyspora limicola TaxID=2715536 RepID=UPI00140DF602|nr:homoserine kinase [Phytoactinopolyspora limicola]
MTTSAHRWVRVRVPATSANLGPGFDAFGLALGLHDVVEVRVGGAPSAAGAPTISVSVQGAGAGEVPLDDGHLVVRAVQAGFAAAGATLGGLELTCHNVLPHGRGLGSSAAAIVAGVLAAHVLTADQPVDDESRAGLLGLASHLEGHPDNVAPCLVGGLTIAWTDRSGVVRVTRLEVHPDVTPVVCIAPEAVSTKAARGLLPASVPHADAARNAGRAALLVEALTRQPSLLLDATEDHLHQEYRRPAMPATLTLVSALREQGLAAVVSGAGPTVLVLGRAGDVARVRGIATGWDVRELPVDAAGATVEASSGGLVEEGFDVGVKGGSGSAVGPR